MRILLIQLKEHYIGCIYYICFSIFLTWQNEVDSLRIQIKQAFNPITLVFDSLFCLIRVTYQNEWHYPKQKLARPYTLQVSYVPDYTESGTKRMYIVTLESRRPELKILWRKLRYYLINNHQWHYYLSMLFETYRLNSIKWHWKVVVIKKSWINLKTVFVLLQGNRAVGFFQVYWRRWE